MNLIVDVGNSFVKLAVFERGDLLFKTSVKTEAFEEQLKAIRAEYRINKTIVSSVGQLPSKYLERLKHHGNLVILNAEVKVPFENLYSTPKTLGVDRIALVSASAQQFAQHDVLIIDAGTCITYDFINDKNQYLGGAIAPGIRMRYKALHTFTANLPLLETQEVKNLIGNSTSSSIHSGVVMGVLKEIEGVIFEYKKKYPDLTVILTGGDANFLSKQLKNSIFANSNFLLEGLNFVLEFNSNP